MSNNEAASKIDEGKENKMVTFDSQEKTSRTRQLANPDGPNILTFR